MIDLETNRLTDRYLTLKALVAYSGIPYSTLRAYIAGGKFAAYKPAGTVLVLKSEFDAWVQESRISPDIDKILAKIKDID